MNLNLFYCFVYRSLAWCQPRAPTAAPWAMTETLTGAWWWRGSGWRPVTRSWTRGSTSCCGAPSSGRSTASLKDRPASRGACSALFAAPFSTQTRAVVLIIRRTIIRFKWTYRGRKGACFLLVLKGCSVCCHWAQQSIVWIQIQC